MATGSKYDRVIESKYEGQDGRPQRMIVDVYCVLDAFEIASQSRGHGLKKGLTAGMRGKGDEFSDMVEAIDAFIEDAAKIRRRAVSTLSPKHKKRLETLRRAESIVELMMHKREQPERAAEWDALINQEIDAIAKAGEAEMVKSR